MRDLNMAAQSSFSLFDKVIVGGISVIMISLLSWMVLTAYNNSLKIATMQAQVESVLLNNDLEQLAVQVERNRVNIRDLEKEQRTQK